jgi:hypothetical protein
VICRRADGHDAVCNRHDGPILDPDFGLRILRLANVVASFRIIASDSPIASRLLESFSKTTPATSPAVVAFFDHTNGKSIS